MDHSADMARTEAGIARYSFDAWIGLDPVVDPMPQNHDEHEHFRRRDTLTSSGFLQRVDSEQQIGDTRKTKMHRFAAPAFLHVRHGFILGKGPSCQLIVGHNFPHL
jgi:hypothetical protein